VPPFQPTPPRRGCQAVAPRVNVGQTWRTGVPTSAVQPSVARTVGKCPRGAYPSPPSPALPVHTQVQLLSARLPVQTLTQHDLNRECRATNPLSVMHPSSSVPRRRLG
jgi:hypothetical protein